VDYAGTTMDVIDAHAHLHAKEFEDDLPAVLAAAESAGVRVIVAVSETVADALAEVTTDNAHRLFPRIVW
jgi:Tat protein secretion system quality control protein TatD with DNase activity